MLRSNASTSKSALDAFLSFARNDDSRWASRTRELRLQDIRRDPALRRELLRSLMMPRLGGADDGDTCRCSCCCCSSSFFGDSFCAAASAPTGAMPSQSLIIVMLLGMFSSLLPLQQLPPSLLLLLLLLLGLFEDAFIRLVVLPSGGSCYSASPFPSFLCVAVSSHPCGLQKGSCNLQAIGGRWSSMAFCSSRLLHLLHLFIFHHCLFIYMKPLIGLRPQSSETKAGRRTQQSRTSLSSGRPTLYY